MALRDTVGGLLAGVVFMALWRHLQVRQGVLVTRQHGLAMPRNSLGY